MIRRQRTFALFFALLLLLSAAVIAVEAGHDCPGADCPVCQLVAAVQNLTKSTSAVAAVLFLLLCVRIHGALSDAALAACRTIATPVSDRVRLLN